MREVDDFERTVLLMNSNTQALEHSNGTRSSLMDLPLKASARLRRSIAGRLGPTATKASSSVKEVMTQRTLAEAIGDHLPLTAAVIQDLEQKRIAAEGVLRSLEDQLKAEKQAVEGAKAQDLNELDRQRAEIEQKCSGRRRCTSHSPADRVGSEHCQWHCGRNQSGTRSPLSSCRHVA